MSLRCCNAMCDVIHGCTVGNQCMRSKFWRLKSLSMWKQIKKIDGLAQDLSNSIGTVLELSYQSCVMPLRGWFYIKMLSCQYRLSHCGDKTILWQSYLHNGISYIHKISLCWTRALVIYHIRGNLKHCELLPDICPPHLHSGRCGLCFSLLGEADIHMPACRSWHSLTPVSTTHLVLFGGYSQERQPLGKYPWHSARHWYKDYRQTSNISHTKS